MGCAANTITLFLNHRGRQPEVIKEKCDCMAAHPTSEGYNLLVSWDGTNGERSREMKLIVCQDFLMT